MHEFNQTFIQILIMLAIAITVVGIAKKLKQPDTIALVLVGLVLGIFSLPFPLVNQAESFISQSSVFQSIIISLFLPILLGDATLKLPFHQLFKQRRAVLGMAFGGTFLSCLLIGTTIYFLVDLPIAVAFSFAALMSATDPISVLSIFKSAGVSQKLSTIMEGESLFNDGIAVVLFKISSIYLLTYMEMGWVGLGNGSFMFLKFAIGGALLGILLGYLCSQVIRLYDDYPFEIAISALLFFGSYFIAEHFGVSGVIAVVSGGFVFGDYGAKIGMSEETKTNINTFWDVIVLIANSIIFLLIGLEIRNISFSGQWHIVFYSIVVVILARIVALYISTLPSKRLSRKERVLLNWGGLKGSLSIALALSLPQDFDGRDTVLLMTFSVVLFSLIVQGLTLKPLIKKLKLGK
ncbi:Na+/H+ antiporter family protein [Gracilibacillus halophilus YIM-C55.5]|uniref:Na+/H+ antiporter family protein n=1 Tax=Gracilibacillus halophilus YIM-C55.5 TaxID=1308866 RepID=N4WIA4_9BACI|nr:sodium:proton antiporter [Gracilibacillus halophilus]ENH95907.1 Na+/H+ antiporter family protein [Gracilibacillus halophilus YIM-C55.5]